MFKCVLVSYDIFSLWNIEPNFNILCNIMNLHGYNIFLWKTEHPMKWWTRGLKYYCCKILTPTPSDFSIPNKEGVHDFTAFLFLHDNYSFFKSYFTSIPNWSPWCICHRTGCNHFTGQIQSVSFIYDGVSQDN